MSELIYLKRQNKITEITTRLSLKDHQEKRYKDLALRGYLFGNGRQYTVPCSRKLKRFIDKHGFAPAPEELMIVAADDEECGECPFTTSYFWITLSNGGYGRRKISKKEAIKILSYAEAMEFMEDREKYDY